MYLESPLLATAASQRAIATDMLPRVMTRIGSASETIAHHVSSLEWARRGKLRICGREPSPPVLARRRVLFPPAKQSPQDFGPPCDDPGLSPRSPFWDGLAAAQASTMFGAMHAPQTTQWWEWWGRGSWALSRSRWNRPPVDAAWSLKGLMKARGVAKTEPPCREVVN